METHQQHHLAEATVEVITQLRRLSAGLEAATSDPKERFKLAVQTMKEAGASFVYDEVNESPLMQIVEKMHPAIRYADHSVATQAIVLSSHEVGAHAAIIPDEWFCKELIEVETLWGYKVYPYDSVELVK